MNASNSPNRTGRLDNSPAVVLIAASVIFVGTFGAGIQISPSADVVRTKRIEFVNDAGETVAVLTAAPKQKGQIVLRSNDGKIVAHIPPARDEPKRNAPLGDWRSKQNWRSLKLKMSKEDVIHLLGEPTRISEVAGQSWWYYGDAFGSVKFDSSGAIGWTEP